MCEVSFATNNFNSLFHPISLLVCNVQICLSGQPNVFVSILDSNFDVGSIFDKLALDSVAWDHFEAFVNLLFELHRIYFSNYL